MFFLPLSLTRAFSSQEVGYCQGMSQVAALLLMYMSDEVRKRSVLSTHYSVTSECFHIFNTKH